MSNEDCSLRDYVCPLCKSKLYFSIANNDEINCSKCEKVFKKNNNIPVFIDDYKFVNNEGIAVSLPNAIVALESEINGSELFSGRIFDADLKDKNNKFLDVGCGVGKHMVVLKNNGIKLYYGFDIVDELVEIANIKYNIDNVFIASANQIPFVDCFFDRCLFYNVVEHCSDPYGVLKEINRILKKDGLLYMDVPNSRSIGDIIFRWGGLLIYGKTSHIQKFTRKSMNKLIIASGFEVLELREQRGIFLNYPQLERFPVFSKIIKSILYAFFGKELGGWELKLKKVA